jgi:creatinine amidohydrolase
VVGESQKIKNNLYLCAMNTKGNFLILVMVVLFSHAFAQEKEVRLQMLRPAQLIELRDECPIAYIPIGLIEWHGVHNALGADALQAEGLAIECARRGGGVAFPPLYYGENRLATADGNPLTNKEIMEGLGLNHDAFNPEKLPFNNQQMIQHYNNLLIHILAQAQALGFKVAVIIAGHFPLIDNAKGAIAQFSQLYRGNQTMVPWCFANFEVMQDYKGDHGGGFETSQMMVLHPNTVDLSLLPPRGEKVVGVTMPHYDPRDANVALGKSGIDETVEVAIREAKHRLLYPELYRTNGKYFRMGLWREE